MEAEDLTYPIMNKSFPRVLQFLYQSAKHMTAEGGEEKRELVKDKTFNKDTKPNRSGRMLGKERRK